LVSLDYRRNSKEIAIAGRIKDAMREQFVPQIARSSINISLVANDSFIPILFELILSKQRSSVHVF